MFVLGILLWVLIEIAFVLLVFGLSICLIAWVVDIVAKKFRG